MLNYSNIFDKEAIDYPSYRVLVDELLAQGETTGPDNSESMLHYTKIHDKAFRQFCLYRFCRIYA